MPAPNPRSYRHDTRAYKRTPLAVARSLVHGPVTALEVMDEQPRES